MTSEMMLLLMPVTLRRTAQKFSGATTLSVLLSAEGVGGKTWGRWQLANA